MPPSGRKGKTRARRAPPAAEAPEGSDVETPEAIATPTRSSRKRARATETTTAAAPASRNTRRKTKDTRAADREDTEGTEAQDASDTETEATLPGEDEIIRNLKVAERQVNATEDFANELLEGQESVPGYGKIAGRDWAYIVRKVEVNIGRPEALERFVDAPEGAPPAGPTAKTVIDIDLGPDRQVSRLHCIISYDPDRQQWFLIVNGRNGLRVDNNLCKRGSKMYLRSGNVIEIANTQMAFITTAVESAEEPLFDASIIRQAQKSSSEDENGDFDRRTLGRQTGLNPQSSTLQDASLFAPLLGQQQQQQQQYQQQRTHPHSSRAHPQNIPPGTPQRSQYNMPKSSPMAGYSRGVMMESTESIDYAADGAKDLKPPHSYAQLIGMAILSTPESKMTLSNIYKYIMDHYAFYRFNTGGWQNSIRHNLSLNKAFTKIARRTDEPGKGMKWMIAEEEYDNFVQQGMKGCRRPAQLMGGTQSTLGSPNGPMRPPGANVMKGDDEITPPMNSYRPAYPTSAMEAYTPDRGPKRQLDIGLGIKPHDNATGPQFDFSRSTPRNGLNAMAMAAANSPPALYVNEESRVGVGALDTPFPLRATARFAPPSTLRRPSDFIQFSSPAPFWKMEGLGVGGTPFRAYDLSPVKTPFSAQLKAELRRDQQPNGAKANGEPASDPIVATTANAENGTEPEPLKRKASPVIHSSSPPQSNGNGGLGVAQLESPTKSRPTSGRLSQLGAVAKEVAAMDAERARTMSAPPVQVAYEVPGEGANGGANGGTNGGVAATPAIEHTQGLHIDGHGQANGNGNGNYTHMPMPAPPGSAPQAPHSSLPGRVNGYAHAHDDGEDEGIDLAKGFQPIGAFHQHARNSLAVGMAAGAFGR